MATPVGHLPVWQRCAWMQPIAIIASRATLIMSQPSPNASVDSCGKPELARADEHDPIGDAALGELPVDAAEADLERQRDVVGEHERPGAGAALAAVDRDEVDAAVARSP